MADRAGLDGQDLGGAIALLLGKDAIVLGRVLPRLADLARSGVGDAKQQALATLEVLLPMAESAPEGAKVVDLLAQISIELGVAVSLPPSLRALASGKSGPALAKALRRVPQ